MDQQPQAAISEVIPEKLTASRGGVVLVLLISVAIAAFFVAYGLYWMINKYIVNKKEFIIPDSKYPKLGTEYTRLDAGGIPSTGNGKRTSMSFWIYLHDIEKFKGTLRHVFHRGDQKLREASPSPLVFLDSTTNKLYVTFYPASQDPSLATNPNQDIYAYATTIADRYGIVIDYIPLQRWVHVAVVVNENSNGGTITAYIDGEIVKSVSSSADNKSISNMMLDKAGSIWTGGSISEEVGPGFSGLVSKITFFNTDINAKDIHDDYMKGPLDSLLARMGLPVYGVRTPVYRIG